MAKTDMGERNETEKRLNALSCSKHWPHLRAMATMAEQIEKLNIETEMGQRKTTQRQ